MAQNDMLEAILSDPEKLQSAIAMASSLFGGSAAPPPAPAPPPPPPVYDPMSELMGKAMPLISQLMQSGSQAITPEKKALLQAVKPFLSETAGMQIDHGIRLVTLAHIASAVMEQFGRKDNDHV